MWAVRIASLLLIVIYHLASAERDEKGPSDMYRVCQRCPWMSYCKSNPPVKCGKPSCGNNKPPQSGEKPPMPPPGGQEQPGPQPKPQPPPEPQPQPQPPPEPQPQPPPESQPQPSPSPSPSPSPAPAPSIGQPLAGLAGPGGSGPGGFAPPPTGGIPLTSMGGVQTPFAGAQQGLQVNPTQGVAQGTSINAAGMPITAGRSANFGGVIPQGLQSKLGSIFGRRRRRRVSLPDWYTKYLRVKMM